MLHRKERQVTTKKAAYIRQETKILPRLKTNKGVSVLPCIKTDSRPERELPVLENLIADVTIDAVMRLAIVLIEMN